MVVAVSSLLAACNGLTASDDGGSDSDGGNDGGSEHSDGGSLLVDGATAATATRYLPGALHSPYSDVVVSRMRRVLDASTGRRDVFAKVGASNTVNFNFAHCFAGNDVRLDQHSALGPTRDHFDRTPVDDGGHSSFDRTSLAATVGWSAGKTLQGNPTPLAQETAAIRPAFAVVLLGTNDTYAAGVSTFARNLLSVVDTLLGLGVVPLLTTIPPRADTTAAAALVPEMNAIIRAVAQARQVPYLDLWQTLVKLPDQGLLGDGIHLSTYSPGTANHACWFTPAALGDGMNQRNLLTLTALDRARRFLVDGNVPEPTPPPLVGEGSWSAPFVIDQLPFVDAADTARSSIASASTYSCGTQDESGPEIVYQVTLTAPTRLRARLFADDGVDVDLHWLDGARPDRCLARADRTLDIDALPGTYWLVADTFVSSHVPRAGAYRLTLVELP